MAVTRVRVGIGPALQPRTIIKSFIGSPQTAQPRLHQEVLYRMKGVVTGNNVYWTAPIIDTAGTYYTGGGTLSNIEVIFQYGAI